ncbi:Wall-associated receptor kinase-like 14 [Hibiscus syriacus]|uniref:Wall-associated receptor kinase-like 14 n=1 Tax=Hibiscus syriacus TaxID=106335 RepID=A0A6A3AQU8_HIBSY|nr:wall-associated receptor kinase-like 14 [Hibiscus syriacus]XP_038997546.1 wall-associated receptor kinase-like 14 [Hibiscus syriacus]KAE8707070.1 Wall-associated receptor kinase-like 14 [Hibiscus syriacus]
MMKLYFSITITAFFVVSQVNSVHSRNKCQGSCVTGNSTRFLPFPFGFSSGCPIQLNCSSSAGVEIGSFHVLNVTSTDIIVDLPAKCDRPIASLAVLFGENYVLSAANYLLLENCSKAVQAPCEISSTFLERSLKLKACFAKSGNMSCLTGRNGRQLLSFDEVNNMRCRYLFSSTTILADPASDSAFSLEMGRVNLEWWVKGKCNCDANASCRKVKNGNKTMGFRCLCRDGFDGDGFKEGGGCRRVFKCNASKFISRKWGGTSVGVLVGGLVAAGALLMGGVLLLCFYIRRCCNSSNKLMNAKRRLCEAAGNTNVPFYEYREIERATDDFSDKHRLGTGAYGTVYAGKLHNDELVAIKRFRYRDPDSIDQVMNEIKLLSSVSHPNHVRLLGCCIEEGEPILVYEFMPNGTLSQHLQRERGEGLPWTVRLTIATETAKAIAYLHSVNPPIFHRDIKSSNILLDYNYRSKVADFGLSRLGMTESSHISTAPQGTPGYLDPQYHQYFHLSDKSDVYSFGVVLIEIITALKVVDFSRPHCEVNLAALATERIGRGCVDEIVDPYLNLEGDAWTLSSIHNVAELAFRCLSFHPDMRPTMLEVVEELERIRLGAWVPCMGIESPSVSSCPSSDGENEISSNTKTVIEKSMIVESRRLMVKQMGGNHLSSFDDVKTSSPVSVQDHWLSEQSSPSTNSLLGNASQRE